MRHFSAFVRTSRAGGASCSRVWQYSGKGERGADNAPDDWTGKFLEGDLLFYFPATKILASAATYSGLFGPPQKKSWPLIG
ncbi:hypothetical protein ACLOJK_013307 [Asimina triloba]